MLVFPGMTIRKTASASPTGGSPVRVSSGTGRFTWTLSRCRGRLKTESQVQSPQFPQDTANTYAGSRACAQLAATLVFCRLVAQTAGPLTSVAVGNRRSFLETVALANVFCPKISLSSCVYVSTLVLFPSELNTS